MAKLRSKVKQPKEQFKRSVTRSVGGDIGIYIILAIFGVIMVLPLVYAIAQSLKPLDELWVFPPRFFVVNPTFKNFTDLFKLMGDSWVPFSRYIFNTAFISVVGTAGNVLFSAYAAYAIAKIPFPGRNFLFKIVVYSLMFNSTVTGITNFITMSALGWVDTYFAVIVPAFCTTFGLYLMKQFMETSVTDAVLESARLDGASENKIFWKIAMPMVKPAWITLIIFAFKDLWNSGANMYIYSEQLKTFNYAISQLVTSGISRSGVSAAATVVMMIVPILVFVITQSNVIETMSASGMKD
ncbi:MAG: carbohydrate ABC transporter permease [Candidatus Woodwardiibium sp.]|jgi:ABC transporter, permease protein|uniref:carbohydrate ABC transporter permease n=1 Tax=Alistipes ihumii TaxID=1470347 RepID=UPI000D78F973|nr:MAG: carbohydrate ABC transporter permease [Clostridiales bacterium]PWL50495.1 MAG: carbohydrate ABC transporter permease [Clostridiales bacterium]